MPELATERGKEYALQMLRNRRELAPQKWDNAALPAGSPMYFYCVSCGHQSDCLPENYMCRPRRICAECQALKELGWLE